MAENSNKKEVVKVEEMKEIQNLEQFFLKHGAVLDILKKNLVRDVDYGKPYPNAKVLVLRKKGAEKLASFLGLNIEIVGEEVLGDMWGYKVKMRISSNSRKIETVASASYDEGCFWQNDRKLPFYYLIARAQKRAFVQGVIMFCGLSHFIADENNLEETDLIMKINTLFTELNIDPQPWLRKFGVKNVQDLTIPQQQKLVQVLENLKQKRKGGIR